MRAAMRAASQVPSASTSKHPAGGASRKSASCAVKRHGSGLDRSPRGRTVAHVARQARAPLDVLGRASGSRDVRHLASAFAGEPHAEGALPRTHRSGDEYDRHSARLRLRAAWRPAAPNVVAACSRTSSASRWVWPSSR